MARRHRLVPVDRVDINVIPLVDIAFLIIIFLLVTSEFSARDRIENLELPVAFESKPEAPQKDRLIVGVDNLGRIILGGNPVTLEQLKTTFEAERRHWLRTNDRTGPEVRIDQRILVQADKNTRWQIVQDILEAAAQKKFHDISFSVKKAKGEGPPRAP